MAMSGLKTQRRRSPQEGWVRERIKRGHVIIVEVFTGGKWRQRGLGTLAEKDRLHRLFLELGGIH
jgi:hypothetical protein